MKQLILITLYAIIIISCKEEEATFYPDYTWHVVCKFDKDSVHLLTSQKVGYLKEVYPGTDSSEKIFSTKFIDSSFYWVNKEGVDYRIKGFYGTRNIALTIMALNVNADIRFYRNEELRYSYKMLVSDTLTLIQQIGD